MGIDTVGSAASAVSLEPTGRRGKGSRRPLNDHLSVLSSEKDMVSGLSARNLSDALPQMVWSTRADGYHDHFNKQWYAFTGVAEGSTDGEVWNDLFHPDDRERAWVAWRHCLASGDPYEIEYRLRHHSGGYRWTLGRALPIRRADGTIIRWVGTCTDVNEQKIVEEQRTLLALEMSHRIKNLFSVVSALVLIEARSAASVTDLAATIQAKIAALGATHTLVSNPSSDFARSTESTLHTMLAAIVEPYQNAAGDRITICGDDCPVGSGAATALALVFHELATNSVKYGALSLPTGSVRLYTRLNADRVVVDWHEHGGPMIAQTPSRSGFGSRLTEATLTEQLKGSIDRRWDRDGLTVLIKIDQAALIAKSSSVRSSTSIPG